MEAQGAQLLQGRVLAAQGVQQGDERLERIAGLQRGVVVAVAQLVLLAVQVLLRALLDRHVLVQLEAGVHAPQRRHGRRQRGADGEGAAAALDQEFVEDVRGVDPQGRAGDVGVLDDLLAELRQLLLRGLPREVDVGLREAGLGQAVQAGRGGERLGQEDDLRVGLVDRVDQPLPEVARLGVRVVDAEDLDAALDPEAHDAQDLLVEALRIVVEVQGVDVLVLLRRVLGVGDGAVGQDGEPIRVGLGPRVVGGALQREVEGDLKVALLGRLDEFRELVVAAQSRLEGVVPAGGGADGPRGPHVARLRGQGVVAALAVDLANRVDRGQVDDVEAHAGGAVQLRDGGGEGAVEQVAVLVEAAVGAGEELVPGTEEGLAALDEDLAGLAAGQQLAQRVQLEDAAGLVRQGRGDAGAQLGVGAQRLGHAAQVRAVHGGGAGCGAVEQAGADLQVVGQLLVGLPGLDLLGHRIAPGGHRIGPRVDAEGPQARGIRHERGVDLVRVVVADAHGDALGAGGERRLLRALDVQSRVERIVALAPDDREDGDDFAGHRLGRGRTAVHLGSYIVDSESSGHLRVSFAPSPTLLIVCSCSRSRRDPAVAPGTPQE